MTALVVAVLATAAALVVALTVLLIRQRIVQRRRHAAPVLYSDTQLRLLTQAALAALLDEARETLARQRHGNQ